MGKVKNILQEVFDKCYQIYQAQGYPSVIDHVNDMKALGKPIYSDIIDEHCKECDNEMPALNHTCLICGCATTEIMESISASVVPEFIKKIDWSELRNQKRALLEHINYLRTDKSEANRIQIKLELADYLEGILNLIDATQDYAVDALNLNANDVFDFELEDGEPTIDLRLIGETDEQYFARINAQTIFEIHIEGTYLYENEDMPEEFIKGIVDDPEHAKKIKANIYANILCDVSDRPENFKIDDSGHFIYDPEMYDYGYEIETYCKKIFNQGKTKQVLVCSNCGSQNVEIKKWYNPNTNEIGVDCEDDAYCNNCEGHHKLDLKEIPIE